MQKIMEIKATSISWSEKNSGQNYSSCALTPKGALSATYEYASELMKVDKTQMPGLCGDCYFFGKPKTGYGSGWNVKPMHCKVTISVGSGSVGAWHNHNSYQGKRDVDGQLCDSNPAALSNVDYAAVSSNTDVWVYLTYKSGGVRLKWKKGLPIGGIPW